MFISDDLLNEIKGIFGIKELNYIKATKTLYDETLLLFKAEERNIAIEYEENNYYISEVEEEFSSFIGGPIVKLSIIEEETCLKLDGIVIKLPGKAFDFAGELVLLVMEDSWKELIKTFIREDLLNEIKGIFNIEEFHYTRAIKTLYDETLLLFKAEERNIAIEFEEESSYYIYEIEKGPVNGGFCVMTSPVVKLVANKEETWLKSGSTIVSFPGKAFDCTGELVLLAIEDSWKELI